VPSLTLGEDPTALLLEMQLAKAAWTPQRYCSTKVLKGN
jgi:hypothetical protein